MTEHPADLVRALTGLDVVRAGPDGRADLADGRRVLVKHSADPGSIAAEVAGLRWLAEPGHLPVPEVLGHDEHHLVLTYLPPAAPTAEAAEEFGRGLARLHQTGAPAFGAPPPGGPVDAWIGRAPMRNVPGAGWPEWYLEHRIRPYLRTPALDRDERRLIDRACERLPEVAGPATPPARLHGDLWAGNACWSPGPASTAPVRGWVIDPAAHGGHPETDLAMLGLFGFPHLNRVLAGYQQVTPLDPGWAGRVGLHQLFPLLVHVTLFGRGYAGQAVAAAESVLSIRPGG